MWPGFSDTSFLNTAPAGTVGAMSLAAWVMVPFPRATNGTRVLLFKNAALQWQIATVNNKTGFYNNVRCLHQPFTSRSTRVSRLTSTADCLLHVRAGVLHDAVLS